MSHVCVLSQLLQQPQQAGEGLSSLLNPLHLSTAHLVSHRPSWDLPGASSRKGWNITGLWLRAVFDDILIKKTLNSSLGVPWWYKIWFSCAFSVSKTIFVGKG